MDAIELAPPDPAWPDAFEQEAAHLRSVITPIMAVELHHIGSTAVPGLAAKPIIDLMGGVADLAVARERLVAPLEAAGYAIWADNPAPDRLFFVKGLPPSAPRRTHHLHLVEPGPALDRHLAFRDHLRAHASDRDAYQALKLDLATLHRDDREAYTHAKADFIAEILNRAGVG